MKQPSAAVRLSAVAGAAALTAAIAWITADVLPAAHPQTAAATLPVVTLEPVVVRPGAGPIAAGAHAGGAN